MKPGLEQEQAEITQTEMETCVTCSIPKNRNNPNEFARRSFNSTTARTEHKNKTTKQNKTKNP
jgi:hypothetical protein